MAAIARADFDVLVRHAGLDIPAAEIDELYVGWGHVEPMLARLRGAGRDRAVEPAHIFRPDAFGGED